MISLLLASLLATVAVASPAPQAYALCSSVNKEIAVGASHYAATAYCSSLLRVPIYTTKATRTTTTIVTKTARKCTETFTAPEVTSTATTLVTLTNEAKYNVTQADRSKELLPPPSQPIRLAPQRQSPMF